MGWFKRLLGDDIEEELPPVESVGEVRRRPRRNFTLLYPRDMPLKLRIAGNPKRRGSEAAKRFELYKDASTVGEALDAGVLYKDIDYDFGCNYISLDKEKVDE